MENSAHSRAVIPSTRCLASLEFELVRLRRKLEDASARCLESLDDVRRRELEDARRCNVDRARSNEPDELKPFCKPPSVEPESASSISFPADISPFDAVPSCTSPSKVAAGCPSTSECAADAAASLSTSWMSLALAISSAGESARECASARACAAASTATPTAASSSGLFL